jgi:ribosome-associated heat shock protein Hsp15
MCDSIAHYETLYRETCFGAFRENRRMNGIRIDKWLWAARFFKTREQASKACDLNRISSNGQAAKASREVKVGDMLRVRNEGGEFQIEVLALSDQRGPAAVAQALYRETEVSKELRQKALEEKKLLGPFAPGDVGRPSKRDRRKMIHSFRGDY